MSDVRFASVGRVLRPGHPFNEIVGPSAGVHPAVVTVTRLIEVRRTGGVGGGIDPGLIQRAVDPSHTGQPGKSLDNRAR